MGRKSINDFYTVFHALSHEISGESSILQEDDQTSVYPLAWGRPDGHGSHFTLELLTYCRSVGIHIVLRPPHTTHILQGEDVVHFAVFKPKYHQAKLIALGRNIFNKKLCRLTAGDLL